MFSDKRKCKFCNELTLSKRLSKDKREFYWCRNCKNVDFGKKDKSLKSIEICEKCKEGSMILKKSNKTDKKFFGCSTFPRCSNARWIDDYKGVKKEKCPICLSFLVKRVAKVTNTQFLGCSNFPKCSFTIFADNGKENFK